MQGWLEIYFYLAIGEIKSVSSYIYKHILATVKQSGTGESNYAWLCLSSQDLLISAQIRLPFGMVLWAGKISA